MQATGKLHTATMGAYGIFVFLGLLFCTVESHNKSTDSNILDDRFGIISKINRNGSSRLHPLTEISQKIKSRKKGPSHKFSDLLPEDYSIHEPPPKTDKKPVPVMFSVSLKNIPEINELKQMISIEMNLRIYWQDKRLIPGAELLFEKLQDRRTHEYINLHSVMLSEIWVPDIYTDYAKSVITQKILSPPISLRLYPNGTIRYSSRLMMELSCPMDFRMYPGDSQKCNLGLESYGFTREELAFSWAYEGQTVNIDHRLTHFDFDVTLLDEEENVNFLSGHYPAIHICLKLNRRLSYHLLQTYIPSSLFVIISWISFLVPIEYAPGRLAISMTLLLTLTAMFGAIRQITPSVSYIKALDIWMVGCIVFVFLSLAEFAFVLRLDKQLKLLERNKKKSLSAESSNAGWEPLEEPEDKISNEKWNAATAANDEDGIKTKVKISNSRRTSGIRIKREALLSLRKRLEFVSAILAPVIFLLFNLCYWPWLLLNPSNIEC